MRIVVRPWQKSDRASIRRITWESWISTYSSFIPENDLRSYFDNHYTEASLLNMFDDPRTKGFIAETEDQIVGYARLLFKQDENRLYVSSLYLHPELESQGIGPRLLKAAEGYAEEKHLDELWLGVMVKNRKALDFYRKVGFLFVREEPFTMEKTTINHLIGYKKIGESTLFNRRTYATFDGGGSLSELCINLLLEQKMTWQNLREGYELLRDVEERDLPCRGSSIRLQYNPGRIKSSVAVVNERKLKCFLCLNHLPEEQKGILYRNEYLILCNPMPVFPSHFTVSHLDHRLQDITEHIDTFLQLMTDLGPGWTVLYNGPKCGASAPDHLHFQVAPSGKMPIEKEMREKKRLTLMTQGDDVILYRMRDLEREVILLKGNDPIAVEGIFKRFLKTLKKVLPIEEEPMINIAGFHENGKWHLALFPRRKHRPDIFFREGNARVVVSPGVIDMGGLLITPVKKDFKGLDGDAVEDIYKEVSLEEEVVKRVIDAME